MPKSFAKKLVKQCSGELFISLVEPPPGFDKWQMSTLAKIKPLKDPKLIEHPVAVLWHTMSLLTQHQMALKPNANFWLIPISSKEKKGENKRIVKLNLYTWNAL